jgi:hypothetical protein
MEGYHKVSEMLHEGGWPSFSKDLDEYTLTKQPQGGFAYTRPRDPESEMFQGKEASSSASDDEEVEYQRLVEEAQLATEKAIDAI